MREGACSADIIKNFDSQLRSLLINNEKGGIQNFFDALYTPDYIDKISGKSDKLQKMIKLHTTFERLLNEV